MFICYFLFLCIDSFIDSFIAGKAMKKLRNPCTVDLVTSDEKLKKLAVQHSFKQFKIFNENMVAVERAKVELTLNQPIYVGFFILDLSKTLYIKRKYPDSTLLFTNTDSLAYQIQTDKVYEDFYADKHLFDFSGYKKESSFYNGENKTAIGKMKGELKGEL